jgi:hypothetical protein
VPGSVHTPMGTNPVLPQSLLGASRKNHHPAPECEP